MSVVPHPSPPGLLGMQHGGHYGQVGGAAAPVDAHMQRQRLLAQLNESTWQRIGNPTKPQLSCRELTLHSRIPK